MRTAVFSTHKFEQEYLQHAAFGKHELLLLEPRLTHRTAIMAKGCDAVSIFVNDDGSATVLKELSKIGIHFMVLRSAGYNHVDLRAAATLEIQVARVPEYSPYAVAEHTVALMLALNRKLIRAHSRIRDLNFSLEGLTGFDMHGKTAGIFGLGKIGKQVATILIGFGCKVIFFDPFPDLHWVEQHPVESVPLDTLFGRSDIITLHAPLTPENRHIINHQTIEKMKKGVMLINTGRGAFIQTLDVIDALKTGQIGFLCLDVYEEEQQLFFEDHSLDILQDDVIARLMTFPNVLITSHQAFLTDTALRNIADITVMNLDCFAEGKVCKNEIKS
jgi:D-lactate dehydrogenase